jgi:hypothetical protein
LDHEKQLHATLVTLSIAETQPSLPALHPQPDCSFDLGPHLKTSVFDQNCITLFGSRLYSKVWPMLSIFDSNKQKTPLEISVVFDRWGAVL